jgi:hypothetical protein
MSSLLLGLLTDGVERTVFQPLELELQKLEVHDGVSSVVLPLPFLETFDPKHRRPPSVRPPDLNLLELSSPQEHVRSQEEVIGLDQAPPPFLEAGAERPPTPWSSAIHRPAPGLGLAPKGEALDWMG